MPGDFDEIADAIAAAANSDTVLVHPGTYTGAGNRALDFGGKNLALAAEGGPEVTVIDCEGADRGIYFHTGEDSASVVSGFTIRNGYAVRGGGLCCEAASPIIDGCVFETNSTTDAGGGIYCLDADPTVLACEFVGNTVTTPGFGHGGGGMQCNASSPVISGCRFNENGASSGGVNCRDNSHPGILNSVFTANGASAGAGVYCVGNSMAQLHGDFFEGGVAISGGGLYADEANPWVTDCIFFRNVSTGTDETHGGRFPV